MPHLNNLKPIISPWEQSLAGQPARGLLALFNYHKSFHFRKPSTSSGKNPRGWKQPPGTSQPKTRMGTRRSFPVRGNLAAWLTRTSRRLCLDGLRSSQTLVSHPPHWGASTTSYCFGNIFLSIQTFSFNVLPHSLSNFYLILTFFRILINFSFSFFAGAK